MLSAVASAPLKIDLASQSVADQIVTDVEYLSMVEL